MREHIGQCLARYLQLVTTGLCAHGRDTRYKTLQHRDLLLQHELHRQQQQSEPESEAGLSESSSCNSGLVSVESSSSAPPPAEACACILSARATAKTSDTHTHCYRAQVKTVFITNFYQLTCNLHTLVLLLYWLFSSCSVLFSTCSSE